MTFPLVTVVLSLVVASGGKAAGLVCPQRDDCLQAIHRRLPQ